MVKQERRFTIEEEWVRGLVRLAAVTIVVSACTTSAMSDQLPSVGGTQQVDSASTTITTTGAQSEPLQGKVEMVELDLEKLQDVGLDLKHLLKGASSLYDEVTIQPVHIVTEPEVIGRGIIINIPIGTEPVGPPQPARKDRVDMAMNSIRPVINLLKKNVDEFVSGEKQLNLPDNVLEKLKPRFKEWIDLVDTACLHENKLEQLTQGPTYDNQAVASLATSIQKNVKELDKTRYQIYKVIRKEGKRLASDRQTTKS